MKKILLILIAAIIGLSLAVHKQEENTIVIYSALEQYRNDDLKTQLDEKFPELNIQIMYIPTAKIAAKIQNEQEGTDADIVVALETGYLEKIKDNLASVKQYSNLQYLPGIQPEEDRYLVWESYGGGFAVNTEILKKYGLKEPKTYEDLLKPEYKNLIAMQDPKSSSTGYNFYLNLVNEWGEKRALEYFDRLNENVKQYSESGSGPVKLLIQGECAIGTALTYQVVTEMNNGNPLKMIYPPQGSPFSLDGISIVKGKDSNPDTVRVFEYIANEALVKDKDKYNPGKILVHQTSTMDNYPKHIKYANMEGGTDLERKEELLSKWKY